MLPHDLTTVLELGSGDGRVLTYLTSNAPPASFLAADRSWAALRANPFPGVQMSLEAVPFGDRSVGVVLCCEVLEHLPATLLEASCAELGRVAARSVIVSVPNRENRARSAIECHACGCRYNPDRHLRSFAPSDLEGLVPGFRLAEVTEAGPRPPVYPRWVRLALERRGILTRAGSPTCPQCGRLYDCSSAARSPVGHPASPGRARHRAERLLPQRRHPYWLCARFDRG